MAAYVSILNSLLEDTCVLVVLAFLLARGKMLKFLDAAPESARGGLIVGIVLGLFGWTEAVFPAARAPYSVPTLVVTFAALAGGARAGLTAALVAFGAAAFPASTRLPEAGVGLFLCFLVGAGVRQRTSGHPSLLLAYLAGATAQAAMLLVHIVGLHAPTPPAVALASVVANGFGVLLLYLVVADAQERAQSEQRRQEIDRQRAEAAHLRALVAEVQLSALRARTHPHFLFNALNAIAELCCVAPERAEAASLNLSQIMRRALETSATTITTLSEEVAMVRAYIQIEQERLGARLRVKWKIDSNCADLRVIPLSLQILVENAINHGLAPQKEGGTVTIIVRRSQHRVLMAVRDDGAGMFPETRAQALTSETASIHGLSILDQQLRLTHGDRARLRLFSQENQGTLAVFACPVKAGRRE